MMDWGMLYGMITGQNHREGRTILYACGLYCSHEDATVTHRDAVQAFCESLECPLVYESPCVLYQVGTDAVNTSDCDVEQTTYWYNKYESHPTSTSK
jgi:hypothetical protein